MANDEKKPIGRILLTRKLVSPEALDKALHDERRQADRTPLASYLADQGSLSQEDALRALSEQYGVPGIDLSQVAILLEHLDVMPRELAELQAMLPVLVRGERLFLAMSNPTDRKVIDELEFVSGKKVYAYVALSTPLQRTIGAAYDAKDRGERYYLGPNVPAQTLARLGLAAPAAAPAPATPAPAPAAADPEPEYLELTDAEPESPAVVLDDDMLRVGAAAEMSTSDFGDLNPEISSVGKPPSLLEEEAPTLNRHGKMILVVDDEADIRNMLRRMLTEKGYRVVEADRGLLALQMVKQHNPDVIILDAMLPELHGFDIARRIKGSDKYGKIPIIMISAVYRGWRIAEDLKSSYGIETYFEKPFRISEVMAAVARAVEKRNSVAPERDPEAIDADAEKALVSGVAAYKAGDLDTAIAHLQRGVQIDPLAYRLHFHLALLHGKKGNIYEGIQELERAVELNAKHFPALKNLAVLYEKAGFRHKAVEMWERCAHAAPDHETRTQVKEHLMSLL